MDNRNRALSPAASRKPAAKTQDDKAHKTDSMANDRFAIPARPEGLRASVLSWHAILICSVGLFSLLGESMIRPIPEGKFEKKDGKLIDLKDFDPVDLGPFPKCHPHFGEHEVVDVDGVSSWVKNDDVSSAGPFPVGHPENPEWSQKSHEMSVKENMENRFKWSGLQPNFHMLALATACVYLGSKHAVWIFTEPPETREAAQLLQKEDAYWFPVMGSGVLFGLFVVLKYLGTEYIKLLITGCVVFMCMFGVGTNFDQFIAVARKKVSKALFTIPYFDQPVTLNEIIGMIAGASMACGFMMTKNWIINNIFGVSFSVLGIKGIGLNSYKTGCIMFIGLFFYDVFWVFGSKSVFGSNVMVSVAKGVDAPIKLMFARSLGGCGTLQHSMLGLGDIVVPGIFIAFLAKFDAVKIDEKKATSFVYLNTCMFSYVLSLITTVAIMLFFNAAQPALLYIVPYVLIASALVAVARGEFQELWNYTISEEDASAGAKADDKKDK